MPPPPCPFVHFPSRRQAEADAAILSELLSAASANVEAQLAAARREAAAGQAEAAAARRQLADQVCWLSVVLESNEHWVDHVRHQQGARTERSSGRGPTSAATSPGRLLQLDNHMILNLRTPSPTY